MKHHILTAFRKELLKISMSLDAETRNNMALRHQKPDFLLEGRLASNDSKETNFIPKLGGVTLEKVRTRRDKLQDKYRKARKPAGAAVGGAFRGAFLGQMLTGGRLGGDTLTRRLGLRGFGALGAGAGLADYYAQKSYKKKKRQEHAAAKSQIKMAMTGSDTFTPGRALTQTRNVGSFQDKLTHKGDKIRPPTLGRAFQLPQV